MPIAFTVADIKLVSFQHTDAMVITTYIDTCDVTRVLVDNGSQAEILFLSSFDQWAMTGDSSRKQRSLCTVLDEGGVEPVGSITLPISFGSPINARTKFIIFDVVDMHYPYNAIFGRDMLNTFKAALHSAYLCLKVPASLGVVSFHDSQKDARNIEQGFTPGHKNVHFLREAEAGGQHDICAAKDEARSGGKTTIEVECDTK
jgi:hypothetical protein